MNQYIHPAFYQFSVLTLFLGRQEGYLAYKNCSSNTQMFFFGGPAYSGIILENRLVKQKPKVGVVTVVAVLDQLMVNVCSL